MSNRIHVFASFYSLQGSQMIPVHAFNPLPDMPNFDFQIQ